MQAIATNPSFKYSRLFAVGLYTLLELADPELAKDEQQRTQVLHQLCTVLNLPESKLQKDLDLYRSNLEKMAQARKTMEDILKAERKKRNADRDAAETPSAGPQASTEASN